MPTCPVKRIHDSCEPELVSEGEGWGRRESLDERVKEFVSVEKLEKGACASRHHKASSTQGFSHGVKDPTTTEHDDWYFNALEPEKMVASLALY